MEDDKQGKKTEVEVQMHNEKKENRETDEEEISLDEEFIETVKEVMPLKDNLVLETMPDEQPQFTTDMDHVESVPVSEWIEAQELIKELQIKLDIGSEELNASESEKSKLKVQVEQANQKLKERENCYHALQLDLRKLKEEASDAELRHNIEVRSLKEALDAQEIKYRELLDMKEAFDMLSLELDSASERIKGLEGDLLSSAEEAQKFEELSREKIKHAEQESKRAAEFEKMLEAANASAKEMKVQMCSMQEELKSVKEQIKEAHGSMPSDFSAVQEDLGSFKSGVLVLDGVEDQNRELSQSRASVELEDKITLEYEKMLEVAKLNAAAMEEKVMDMQEEIRNLHDKIAEQQQIKDELGNTIEELSLIKKELSMSKNREKELEQKSTSEETIIKELKREISLYKDSEGQAKKEILELQAYLTDLKADHHAKISIFQDIEMKYNEEFQAREAIEIGYKDLEKQVQELHELLLKVGKEKELGETASLGRDDYQQQFKDACSSLQGKLTLSEQKFKEADSLLSRSLAEKLEVEQKLMSLDEGHKKALSELTLIKRELNSSKNQVIQLELKTFAAEALIEELKREVHLHKDYAEQAKKDLLELQSHFSDLKEEHHVKVTALQNIELRYIEESVARESMEIVSKSLREEILNLKEKLVGISKEKESLEALLVERDNNMQQMKDAYDNLIEKLGQPEEKLKEMDSALALAFTEKRELEKKLSSLVEMNKESAQIAKSATERNFDLEDLIRSSNAAELEVKAQMKEAMSKIELLHKGNVELEEQLIIAESKFNDRQYEVEELQKKMLEFELKLSSVKDSHKKELGETVAKLTFVREELNASKKQVIEWEQKYISEGAIIQVLKRELSLYKDSEEQAKKELLESQSHLSDLKEQCRIKVSNLQEVELKYNEEFKAREASEVNIKSLEREIMNLRHQLVGVGKEKKSLEALLIEHEKSLQQTKDAGSDLEEKLAQSEEKTKKMESALLQAFSEKHDLEEKLHSLVEVNKESAELAKSATQRNFDLEDLIRSSNAVESEVKAQMKEAKLKLELLNKRNVQLEEQLTVAESKCNDRQYEVEQLQKKMLEFELKLSSVKEAHKKELSDTVAELTLVKEKLNVSKNQVVEWEKKSISQEAVIQEFKRELSLYEDSEGQARKELLELQSQLSDLMEEYQKKMISLQDVELKFNEEFKAREASEVNIKSLEREIMNLQHQLVGVGKEKESLEALLIEHEKSLQQTKDAFSDLEEKLARSEEKPKKMESDLKQAFSEKHELEEKLHSLVEVNKESAELANSATRRNFDLEDLIRSSNAAESEVKAQMKEANLKLELLHKRNVELEEEVNISELKCNDRQCEVEQLKKKMLEFEMKLSSVKEAHKKELSDTMAELTLVKEELNVTKNQVVDWEKKSMSEQAIIQELKRELSLYRDSEGQARKEVLEVQSQLSDLMEEYNKKIISLQDSELKFNEEFKARETTEISLKNLESEILYLQKQAVEIGKEKASLEALLVERDNDLQQSKDSCCDLEEKLTLKEEKLKDMDSVLSQVFSEKDDLEQKLSSFVEINKESAELARSATKRNFDLEDLIRSSNAAAWDLKAQMKEAELKLQLLRQRNTDLEEQLNVAEVKCSDAEYEVKQLRKKISELEENLGSAEEAHKKELHDTMAELTLVKRELGVSKNQVSAWEQKSISEEAIIQELKRELSSYKDSEGQARKEILELQSQLSDRKEEYYKKITSLQDVELRFNEEFKSREATEISLKNLEREISNLQKQVVEIGKEKASLEALLVESDNNLQESKDACCDLKKKLAMTEEKLKERDLLLSLVVSEKDDLEQKLGSLVEINKESAELAKSATQRNFDLEDLIRSSNAAESELKGQMKEAETKLQLLHQRNTELEEQLHVAEVKCSDREYEVEQLKKKILELEQRLGSAKEELGVSRNQVVEWEQKSISEEAIIQELKRELSLYKDSEGQAGKELLELQSQLSDLKEEYHTKITSLQDVELRFNEEFKAREATEISLKNLESEISNLQKQVVEMGMEKASLDALLVEWDSNLQESKDACCDLEEKLAMTEEKLRERDSHLSQVLSENNDLEQKLGSLVEVNKESAELARSAMQRNFDLEDLLRSSNAAESELKAQMKEAESKIHLLHQRNTELEERMNVAEIKYSDREYEVVQLEKKILELEQKLGSAEEELGMSSSQVVEWEQKSISEEAMIQELKRELTLYKDSEEQSRNELLELQTQFSALKEEYHINITSLQDIELKFNEEFKARKSTEVGLKSLEREILNLQEQLAQIGKDKVSLEALLVDHDNKLQQTEDICCDLEEKLSLSEEKLKEMDSALSQASSEKHDLEQKLRSLVELNKESAALAKSATQRSFDLEDLVKSSNAAESEAEARMKEAESKLESLQQRMLELEEQLKTSELKCCDREYEIEKLQTKILEFEQKLSSHGEVHNKVLMELALVKDELDVSRNQVVEWKQKAITEGAILENLKSEVVMYKDSEEQAQKETLELQTLYKNSEEQARKKILELQTQLSDLEKEHHVKVTGLLDFERKYSEELKAREAAEVSVNLMEKKILYVEEQLEDIGKKKERLEAFLVEDDEKLQQTTNTCNVVQEKLSLSEEKLRETDLLLSQTLTEKIELEQKLGSLEKLQRESATLARTVTQRNLDLEDLVRSSTAMESEVRAKLRDTELKLISLQQKNVELEEQLSISELKCSEREYEVEKLRKKISDLASIIKGFEEEKELSRCHMQAYEDKVSQLESSLNMSTKQNTEFELQLKDLTEKCTNHETEASTSKKRSLELEDLISLAHSKSKDAESRVAELVLQLDSTMHQLQELEEQQRVGEVKYKDAEAEIKQLHGSVTELSSELEAFRVRSASLEFALQDANEKEKQLTGLLNVVTEAKNSLEMYSQSTSQKLSETRNSLELVENELKLANERKNSVEKSLEESEIREKGLGKELRSAQDQLECQSKAAEKATMKILEVELQLESLSKDSESKLQEALAILLERDSQIEELSKTVSSSKEESSFYRAQLAEAAQKIEALQDKMEEDTVTCISLENVTRELESKVEDTKSKLEWSLSENEMMTAANHQLKKEMETQQSKNDQLQELMNLISAEKEAATDQLACHIKSLTELTEQHSRSRELHSATELYARETEAKLQEAVALLTVKDSEARELNEKLLAIERQEQMHKERAAKAANVAEIRKSELEENVSRLRWLQEEFERRLSQSEFEKEILSNANLKLTQELETSRNKLQELHARLDQVLLEKEDANERLHSSKTINDDLNQRLASEGDRFQAKLSPIIEENNLLNKMLEETKRELKAVIVGLEEQLKEEKEKGELLVVQLAGLKSELVVKSGMQAKTEELQQLIISMQIQHKNEMTRVRAEKEELWSKLEETACKLKEKDGIDEQLVQLRKELHITQSAMAKQRDLNIQREMEREASMKKAHDEYLDEHEQKLLLEKYIMEIEEKLIKAESKCKETEKEGDKRLSALTSELNHMNMEAAESEKRVMDLENELKTANAIIIKQDMEGAKKHLAYIAELDDKQSKIAKLEKEVMNFENELHMANTRITEQDMERDIKHIVSTSELDGSENKVAELEKKVVDLQNELEVTKAKLTKQDIERDNKHIVSTSELHGSKNMVAELETKVVDLQNELEIAKVKITKQDIERDKKHIVSTSEVDGSENKDVELEKKIVDLQNELQIANAKITKQEVEIKKAKSKAQEEMTSRDIDLEPTLSRRKGKKRGKGPSDRSLAHPTPATAEPTLWDSLKFVMGIAFFSMVIGIILGKRY